MDLVFSLLLALGVVVGLARSAVSVSPERVLRLVDLGLLVLVGASVGGRVGYVGLNWSYFETHPGEIFQFWLGGISGLGAAYGFVFGLLLVAWLFDECLLKLADSLLPLGMSLAAAGWLAAWWGGSAYGAQMEAWYAVPARGESGVWAMRFPTQLLGALLSLAVWVGLDFISHRLTTVGLRAALGMLGIGLVLAGLSLTRVDPLPTWRSLRLDTWAALGLACLAVLSLALLGLVCLVGMVRRGRKDRSNLPV